MLSIKYFSFSYAPVRKYRPPSIYGTFLSVLCKKRFYEYFFIKQKALYLSISQPSMLGIFSLSKVLFCMLSSVNFLSVRMFSGCCLKIVADRLPDTAVFKSQLPLCNARKIIFRNQFHFLRNRLCIFQPNLIR